MDGLVIAVLGGTGNEGGGLALRWAHAGRRVIIGSRDATRAAESATRLSQLAGNSLEGLANREAAAKADIIVLAVPYAAQVSTAEEVAAELAGKILIDVTVPLMPPKVSHVQLPVGGSAALALQQRLGEDVRVVSAFQNVSAHQLSDLGQEINCDVLVCSNDDSAREQVVALAQEAGMRAWHAGPLANSAAAEALTSILIGINRRYKVPGGAGIRITGIDDGS